MYTDESFHIDIQVTTSHYIDDDVVRAALTLWGASNAKAEMTKLLTDPNSAISRQLSEEMMAEFQAKLLIGKDYPKDPIRLVSVDSWEETDEPRKRRSIGLPPVGGERILAWILPFERAEAVLGDLDEKFRKRIARGVSKNEAVTWYYWHVARSSGHFLFELALRFIGIEQLLHKIGLL
jgi:hypothetical protein